MGDLSMKKTILITIAAFSLVSTQSVMAEPSSNVAFDAETRAILRAADPAKGKEIELERVG